MDLEKELLYLKAQIHEIEEKLRNSNHEREHDYEADLIDKVYEICHDEHDTSDFLDKVMQVCALDSDKKTIILPNKNTSIKRYHDVLLPKIIDYSIMSEAEDTFMERKVERIQSKYLPIDYGSKNDSNCPPSFINLKCIDLDAHDKVLDVDRIRRLKKM